MLIAVAKWGITINTLFYVKCLLFVSSPWSTRHRSNAILPALPPAPIPILSRVFELETILVVGEGDFPERFSRSKIPSSFVFYDRWAEDRGERVARKEWLQRTASAIRN